MALESLLAKEDADYERRQRLAAAEALRPPTEPTQRLLGFKTLDLRQPAPPKRLRRAKLTR